MIQTKQQTKTNMKQQIEIGQTLRRGGARGKLWKVDEVLTWPQGIHARLRSLDDPTTTHLIALDSLIENGYALVD